MSAARSAPPSFSVAIAAYQAAETVGLAVESALRTRAPDARSRSAGSAKPSTRPTCPHDAVCPLATLLWSSYALLDADHVERVDKLSGSNDERVPLTWRMSERRLADGQPGPGWSAWRGGTR